MEVDKPQEANVFLVEGEKSLYLEKAKRQRRNRRIVSYVLLPVVVAALTFITAAHYLKPKTSVPYNRELALKGAVDLTAQQLRELVVSAGLIAYWAGPQLGAKYTLNVLTDGQIYVRYLPNGNGLNDTRAAYRVIGTYSVKSAFADVQQSGTQANSVGFINQDGDSVFYNKSRPTNLYLGLKLAPIEVEIFDPDPVKALVAATGPGIIQSID